MDQKQTLELYQEILRGAQIGMGSIDELMKKSEDVLFREEKMCIRDRDIMDLIDIKDKNEQSTGNFFEAMLDDILIHLEK